MLFEFSVILLILGASLLGGVAISRPLLDFSNQGESNR